MTRSRTQKTILAALAVCLFTMAAAMPAPALEVEADAQIDFLSDYVWRGITVNDEAVLQPSLTITKPVSENGALSFNVWGNFDLTDEIGTEHDFSEIDLTASYSHSFGPLGLEAGVIHYTFPDSNVDSTSEVYLSAGYDFEDIPLGFSLTGYYDFEEISGFYGLAEVSSGIALSEKVTLDLGLGVGYGDSDFNGGYYGVSDSALVDGVASAGLTWAVNEDLSVSAGVQYMYLLDGDLRDSVSGNDEDKLTGGISIAYSF